MNYLFLMATAARLAAERIDGIKIHLLHIQGSRLETEYRKGAVTLLDETTYVGLVCDVLEALPPEAVVMRLTGEGTAEDHIAPDWARAI